jgi:hypothetical protein
VDEERGRCIGVKSTHACGCDVGRENTYPFGLAWLDASGFGEVRWGRGVSDLSRD